RIREIEARIEALEARQREHNLALADPALYDDPKRRDALLAEYQRDSAELSELTDAWELAQAELDEARAGREAGRGWRRRRGRAAAAGAGAGQLLGVLAEVRGHGLGAGGHARVALAPAGRAHLAVLLVELQRVDQAHQLVHVATEREVVDDLRAHEALAVDEERGAQGHAAVGLHPVGAADLVLDVGGHGVAHGADAARVDRGAAPGVVGVLRVDRDRDHLDVALAQRVDAVVERDELGRTHE